MPIPAYVDTNVILYHSIPEAYGWEKRNLIDSAREFFARVGRGEYEAIISPAVLIELIVVARKIYIERHPSWDMSAVDDRIKTMKDNLTSIKNVVLLTEETFPQKADDESVTKIISRCLQHTSKCLGYLRYYQYKSMTFPDFIHLEVARLLHCSCIVTAEWAFDQAAGIYDNITVLILQREFKVESQGIDKRVDTKDMLDEKN